MARTRALIAATCVALAAGGALAAGSCEEDRGRTGLALAIRDGVLTVAAVDPESSAARAGLRPGDGVAQVNGVVPRSCSEYAKAVRDAREDHKALLVLVRRADDEVPLALAARTWGEPPPAPVVTARPSVPAPEPPPPPLPPEVPVALEQVVHDLQALAPDDTPPASLGVYRKSVRQARREIETLASRKAAPPEAIAQLRQVIRHYEAAEVAWDAEEQLRERDHRPRNKPLPEGATAPYFEDSVVGAILEEFPFLQQTVVREPRGELLQSSGSWRPIEARQLLWQHATAELATVTGAPPPRAAAQVPE